MCGIFGYSFKHGKLSAARRAVLATNLARYNDERGGDSWGVCGINQEGPHVSRGLGDLSDSAYELCEYNTLFAHTRSASVGDVTIKNAHPFKFGNILGAHNGRIYNNEEIAAKYGRKYPVDSMHIFAHLNENRSLEELVGRGTIEWINIKDPKTVYLCKFHEGELAVYGVGEDEDKPDGIVWSSSYRHLMKSLYCAGIHDFFRYEVRRGNVYAVRPGEFSEEGIKLEVTKFEPKPQQNEEGPVSDEAGAAPFRKKEDNGFRVTRPLRDVNDFRM